MTQSKLTLATQGDREVVFTRAFAASREMVFDCMTKPDLVKRWLLGPPGWTMPQCDIDLRVGGAYRYVWQSEADGARMGLGGQFREVAAPARLVATERFDDAWYPGQALDTTEFTATDDGRTRVTITVLYESQEARDTARRSGMEHGMAAGYDRLESLLLATQGDAA